MKSLIHSALSMISLVRYYVVVDVKMCNPSYYGRNIITALVYAMNEICSRYPEIFNVL
jgi:hypothetical protein